ncbi:MAG TPA: hypothetical protein VFS00_13200, partial [Polyangiaceae bacterium]|nr:hypothetical protein [Polyangiaceae bacterium]
MSFSSSRRPALRSVFSSILLGPLGVAAAALGGCWVGPEAGGDRPVSDAPVPVPVVPGAGGAGGGGSVAGFRELSCDDFGPDALGALDVDALEVWSYRVRYEQPYPDGSGEGPGTRVYEKSLSLGAPCAGARDAKGCEGALEAARNAPWAEGGWPGRVTTQRLLVTKGDEVALIESYEALLTRLLPIDRFDKLPLVLRYAEGGGLSCQAARLTLEGFEVWGEVSFGSCPIMNERRLLRVGVGGDVSVLARDEPVETGACAGRRPAGLAEPAAWSGGALGRYLARQAYLEAASVEAFERLALELASFGAPPELVALARRAGADEVRHHALIVALGRRFAPDFACPAPEAAPARARSRFEFALENAVEGCVRETWGALVA